MNTEEDLEEKRWYLDMVSSFH